MKILITAGAGFIDSNLCEYFINKNHEVVCLDNFSTDFLHYIEPLKGTPNFTFFEVDIRDMETCRKAVQECDAVLHQAALDSVPRSINAPLRSIKQI